MDVRVLVETWAKDELEDKQNKEVTEAIGLLSNVEAYSAIDLGQFAKYGNRGLGQVHD